MTAAAISSVNEFSVTVTGECALMWKQVLGMDEVPILSPSTSLVTSPGGGQSKVYRLDVKALSGEQHARLALYISNRSQRAIDQVMDDLLSAGYLIPAECCTVVTRSARWYA